MAFTWHVSTAEHRFLAQLCIKGAQGCCFKAAWGITSRHSTLTVPMAEPHLVLLHELLSSWEGTGKVSAAEKKHQPQFGG